MAPGGSAPRTPLQKSLSRRVSFNEATLSKAQSRPKAPSSTTTQDDSDTESQTDNSRPHRGCGSLCNSCCAWTSLIIGIIVIIFLLLIGVYFGFLQSNLPQVRLHRLDVNAIQVTNTTSNTLLTADFEVRLNTTNASDKMELRYSSLIATLSSAGVDFRDVKLADMQQPPQTATDVSVRATIQKAVVEEAAAEELQDNVKQRTLVIDVVVKGHVDFYIDGKKINGFPFKIDCSAIDQTEIDYGHAPKCNAKMTPLE